MARLSNSPLDEKTYRQTLDVLDVVLGKMKKDEVRSFLFSLFGKNERIMVSKRFAAILLLSQGVRISDVSRKLKLTKQTINRLRMLNEIKNKGFTLALKKAGEDKIARELIEVLTGLAKTSAELFLKYKIKPPNDFPNKKV